MGAYGLVGKCAPCWYKTLDPPRPRTRRLGTSVFSAVSWAWLTWRFRPTPPPPPDNQSVALPEEDIPGEVTVTEGGDPEYAITHGGFWKATPRGLPTQMTPTGPALSRSAMAASVPPRPSETPTAAKQARVAPDRSPPPACAPGQYRGSR